MTIAKVIAASPLVSETRVPKMTRLNRSRKLPSVPSRCSGCVAGHPSRWTHGPDRLTTPSSTPSRTWFGSWVAMNGAKIAMSTSRMRIVIPTTAERWRRTLPSVSRQRLLGRAAASGSPVRDPAAAGALTGRPLASSRPDPRVEIPVGHVDDQVRGQVDHGDDQGEALDDHVVAAGDRLHEGSPDPGGGEAGLAQEGS